MIYLIILSSLIGAINTNFGITIGSIIKINITDILLIIFLVWLYIIKKNKIKIFKPIKLIIVLLLTMSISLYWGIINGAQIGESIRILRNILYIILVFSASYTSYSEKKNLNLYNYLISFSWIAIINCLLIVFKKYTEINWFVYYRENPSFQVFMFTFLLFYEPDKKEKLVKLFIRITTIIFLGLCIFLSQERLQIIAVVISISINIINKIINIVKAKRINLRISISRFLIILFVTIIIIFMMKNILNIRFIQNYIEYFVKYRINSVINNGTFISDSSLNGRQLQLVNILNRNFIDYLFGTGLGSLYMSATGLIHIVDGMWLWIFKDLGLIGLLILLYIYLSIFIEVKKIKKNKLAMASGLISILVLQIFTPNIMIIISDSVFIGYILCIICLSKYSNIIK